MLEVTLKFENQQAMDAVVKEVLDIKVGEYVENTAPNSVERVGDTIFFTRQPEPVLVDDQYAVTAPDGTAVVSDVEEEVPEEVFIEESGSNGELENEGTPMIEEPVTEPLPEVDETNVTEVIEVDEESV